MLQAERHFRRGQRALGRGSIDRAVDAFRKAAETVPDEAEFAAFLGWALHLAGAPEAQTTLERAVALGPTLALTHLFLARHHRANGDLAGARNAYEQALAADPDHAEALDELRALK